MEQAGFIIISKKLLKWEWADDPLMGWLWIHLLLMASYEEKKWHGITVQRGQVVTSIASLAKSTGLSAKEVRSRIQKLEESGCLDKQTTNKYTILTICKYDDYQLEPNLEGKQRANKGQTKGKQRATSNEYNKENKYILSLTHACEAASGEDLYLKELAEGEGYQTWRERICMNRHFTIPQLVSKLTEFHKLMQERMETHTDIRDYASHFVNMIETNSYEKVTTRSNNNSGACSKTSEVGKSFKPSFDF